MLTMFFLLRFNYLLSLLLKSDRSCMTYSFAKKILNFAMVLIYKLSIKNILPTHYCKVAIVDFIIFSNETNFKMINDLQNTTYSQLVKVITTPLLLLVIHPEFYNILSVLVTTQE